MTTNDDTIGTRWGESGPTEEQIDFAKRVLNAEYFAAVRSYAQELADEIKSGAIADEDALTDRLHEQCDGSEWVIYTYRAQQVVMCSDNSADALAEMRDLGDTLGSNVAEVWAYHCLSIDVRERLGDVGPLFDARDASATNG